MPNLNLQDSFIEFCRKNKYEKNESQLEIIDLLNIFLKSEESFLNRIFKKKRKTLFLFIWKGRCR